MSPDELYNALHTLGATIGRSTIRKYVVNEIAPASTCRSLGRGSGRESEYPEEALTEIYAAWKLLNGPIQTNIDRLKTVRSLSLEIIKTKILDIDNSLLSDLEISTMDLAYLIELWLNYCEDVKPNPTRYRISIKPKLEHRQLVLENPIKIPKKVSR